MIKADRIKVYSQFMPGPYTNAYFIDRLDKLGFFDSPASAKYHGAYEGGLFDHSFAVAKYLVELTEKLKLQWLENRSPYIVGMFHDLCKAGYYEKLEGEPPMFAVKGPIEIPGHGERSVIMLQKELRLTDEEILCIRWHMGAFETDTAMWKSYNLAVRLCPNVLWTHAADMYVSQVLGV